MRSARAQVDGSGKDGSCRRAAAETQSIAGAAVTHGERGGATVTNRVHNSPCKCRVLAERTNGEGCGKGSVSALSIPQASARDAREGSKVDGAASIESCIVIAKISDIQVPNRIGAP